MNLTCTAAVESVGGEVRNLDFFDELNISTRSKLDLSLWNDALRVLSLAGTLIASSK